jgi:hypothetical protein
MAALFPTMVGPGFVPSTAATTVDELLRRLHEDESSARKVAALHKRWIWDEAFTPLVQELIQSRWENWDIKNRMERWITLDINAGKDITRHIAIAYSYGTRRLLKDGEEDQEKAWKKLLGEIDTQMVGVNRGAFLAGPVAVIPVVKKGRLARQILWPDAYDIQTDPSDPFGHPVAVGWEVNDGTNTDQTNQNRVRYVVVDQEAWHYYNASGSRVRGPDGLEVVPHGCLDERKEPTCPAEIFRLDEPQDPDWWSSTTNDRLLWATVEICLTLTRLRFLRKSRDHKLMSLIGLTSSDKPPNQLLADPEAPVELYSKSAPSVAINVHDHVVDPTPFFSEIMFGYGNLVESYGLPASSITWNFMGSGETTTPNVTLQASKKHLSHIRSEHIGFFDPSERRLSVKTSAVVRASGIPALMEHIPPPDEMFEQHTIEYPDLDTIDDPKARREQDEWELKNGMVSRVDLVQRKWTHLGRPECMDLITRNVEEETKVNELLAKRNLPLGNTNALGEDVSLTADQVNGAQGPQVRDNPRSGGPPPPRDRGEE